MLGKHVSRDFVRVVQYESLSRYSALQGFQVDVDQEPFQTPSLAIKAFVKFCNKLSAFAYIPPDTWCIIKGLSDETRALGYLIL